MMSCDSLRRSLAGLLAGVVVALLPAFAKAEATCVIIKDITANREILREGPKCDQRFSPASTFKLALALMGFEERILTSAIAPRVDYDPRINAHFKVWRQQHTPQSWLRFSVIWYSQWLTQSMGLSRFQAYVDAFDYGNADLSGDTGKNNGITRAWLSSSLQISPKEQLAFLERLRTRSLGASDQSYALLDETVQRFTTPGGRSLQGKTGTAWALDATGARTTTVEGWFVGWMIVGDAEVVFVRHITEGDKQPGFAGNRARDALLQKLDQVFAK